jgi:hypothetical protein
MADIPIVGAAKKLFTTNNREEAHARLVKVLKEGKYPAAECREHGGNSTYEVWSGPEVRSLPSRKERKVS